MSFQFFRRFFYEIHLWLGIVSGVILFLVCLSGTIYVFREEAQHFAEPSRYYVKVPEGKTALTADELIAKVEAAKPGMKVASITIPEKPNRTVTMTLASVNQGGERSGSRSGAMERGPRGEGGRGERGNRGEGRGERAGRPEGGRRQRLEGANGTEVEGDRGPRGEGGRRADRNPESRPETGVPGGEGSRSSQAEIAATGQGGRPGASQGTPPQGGRGGHGGGGGRGRGGVQVDPYTGDIVGEGANKVDPLFMSMFRLHRFLWFSGEWQWIGKMIVGIATLVFVAICLTGIVLWLPRTWSAFTRWKAWKPGLRIRFKKGLWPFLYDTHNTIGFYLLIPALILALTGLCWSFRWYNQGLGNLLGLDGPALQRGGGFTATFAPSEDTSVKPLSVTRMIELQNELTPGPGEIVVSIPQAGSPPQQHEGEPRGEETREDRGIQAMSIQKGRTGFFSLVIKDRTQWDYYRGKVVPVESYGKTVEVERFADRPLKNQIAGSIRAIHFGNITGLSSKLFFFVVCLFATSWPVTGVLLWIKKLRAKYRKRKTVVGQRSLTASSGALPTVHPKEKDGENTSVSMGQTV